jgi:formate dehydrogenase major subunit
MMVFGHGGNTITRMPEAAKGIEKLDLLVVGDPHPTTWAALSERKNDTYLLPICTQFETAGSRTASNRSLQWGEAVVKPIFESKDDYEAMYLLAKKLGLAEQMFKNIKVEGNVPSPEDIFVIVAGGSGKHSAVVPNCTFSRAVSRPIVAG